MLQRSNMYSYQSRAAGFMRDNENCALYMDCGLGKSVSALTGFNDLLHSFDARRALVVAPLRVARKVWSDEINEWAHLQNLSVAHIVGDVKQRMAGLRTPADIHCINREQIPWLGAQFVKDKKLLMRWPWDTVILDESQSFKSQSSERWKTLNYLRKLFPRCVLLSGTPIPNGYKDLWAQFQLLDRGQRLGFTESAFLDRWFDQPKRGSEFATPIVHDWAIPQIQAAIADITLSLRAEDYLDLPPVVHNFIRVQLSPAAMQVYKRMEREFITEVKGKSLTAVNAGVLDNKLLQLANGVVYTGEGREVVEFHEEKLAALEELLEAIPGKILLAYYYRHDKARIEKTLAAFGRPWAALSTDKEFADWAAGKWEVGLLHPASAGHGLNDVYKSGAEDIVHYGVTANLEWYEQVNARLAGGHRRMGRNVKIHHIIAERTRDEDYVSLIKGKALTQDGLMRSLGVKIREA